MCEDSAKTAQSGEETGEKQGEKLSKTGLKPALNQHKPLIIWYICLPTIPTEVHTRRYTYSGDTHGGTPTAGIPTEVHPRRYTLTDINHGGTP